MATVLQLNANTTSGNVDSYQTTSFSPLANDLLLTFVVASGTVTTAPALLSSGQSISFVNLGSLNFNSTTGRVIPFIATSLASTTAMNLTFTCTDDAATGSILLTAGIAGMTLMGSSAVLQIASSVSNTAFSPATTFGSACSTNNPTLVFLANLNNPAGITIPTGWTLTTDVGYATPTIGAQMGTRNNGFNGTAITWGSSSTSAGTIVSIELDASTGAAAGSRARWGSFSMVGVGG